MWIGVLLAAGLVTFFVNLSLDDVAFYSGQIDIGSLAIMMSFLAISLSVYTYKDFKLSLKKNWPHAQGRIEDVKVESTWLGKKIKFRYSYTVNDLDYYNTMFDFAQEYASEPLVKMHPQLRGRFITTRKARGKVRYREG